MTVSYIIMRVNSSVAVIYWQQLLSYLMSDILVYKSTVNFRNLYKQKASFVWLLGH